MNSPKKQIPKAVILAAGRGDRFGADNKGRPKCLLTIYGVSILERVIYAAKKAGIRDFVIVTGFEPEAIPAAIGDGAKMGVRIEYVHNDKWDTLTNGYSVFAAKESVGERFVVLMSDHIFNPEALKKLLVCDLEPGGCLLATDPSWTKDIDLDDATKVRASDDGRILEMGKEITEFNAIDTGMFYTTSALVDALEEALEQGESSLTAANRMLIERGAMKAVPVKEISGHWFDLDTPEMLSAYKDRLVDSLIKPHDGIVSRFFNRPISIWCSKKISEFPVTPNMISVVLFLFGVWALTVLKDGRWLLGAVAIQAISILDGVDGEISRLKNQGSYFGAYLDWISDRLIDMAVIAAIGWGAVESGQVTFGLVLACMALVVSIYYWFSQDILVVTGGLELRGTKKGSSNFVFNFRRDIFIAILAMCLLIGSPLFALCFTILTRGCYAVMRQAVA